MKLLLATTNAHKVREILEIWGEIPFEVLTLKDFSHLASVEEDGLTFKDNALKKAREISAQTGLLTVSDDSGLEVEGLNGRPGVYSARYAGVGADDQKNLEKVLEEIKVFPPEDPGRRACFRCVAAVVSPHGAEHTFEGKIEGIVVDRPAGEKGFGYDPLFWVNHFGKTLAQVDAIEKNAVSHRGEAFRQVKEFLLKNLSLLDPS